MTTTPNTTASGAADLTPEIEYACLTAWSRSVFGANQHDTVHPMYLTAFKAGYKAALAASAPVAPTPPKLFLNGFQLRAALDFIAPDGDDEQLESEVCIQHGPERTHDEGTEAAGMYCWLSDYPDEGSIRLDDESTPEAAPVAPAPITEAEQAAWHAGLDEGRSQARGAAQAAPSMDAKQLGDAVVKWLGCETTKPRGDTGEPERRIDVSVERLGFAVAAVLKTVTAPAPVVEDAEIRKALHDAATSLETISRIAGKDQYMLEMIDVRIYAAARAKVAREAQAAQPEGGA